jgi:hypothetical protein
VRARRNALSEAYQGRVRSDHRRASASSARRAQGIYIPNGTEAGSDPSYSLYIGQNCVAPTHSSKGLVQTPKPTCGNRSLNRFRAQNRSRPACITAHSWLSCVCHTNCAALSTTFDISQARSYHFRMPQVILARSRSRAPHRGPDVDIPACALRRPVPARDPTLI